MLDFPVKDRPVGSWDENNHWGPLYKNPRCPFHIGQGLWEFEQLLKIYSGIYASNIIEIGTDCGGTLYHWAEYATYGATVISIDPLNHTAKTEHWKATFRPDVNIEVYCGLSKDFVNELYRESFYDFVFIDGDHSYEGARFDFLNYGKMVCPGGIIALHDILPNPVSTEIEVPRLWNEIRAAGYTTKELCASHDQQGFGIGLVFVE